MKKEFSKKFYIVLVLIISLAFAAKAIASVTISAGSIIGEVPYIIDVGENNTLFIQTAGNGPVTFGTGLITLGNNLTASGTVRANSLTAQSLTTFQQLPYIATTDLSIYGIDGPERVSNGDGRDGGDVYISGGYGSSLYGSGANDGSGGDIILLAGEAGGSTGTAVNGIVRIGSPSVQSTKTTDLLAVGGGFEVDGNTRFDGTISSGASTGTSRTVTVRDEAGTGTCTLIFVNGLYTGGTCSVPTP